MWRIGRPLLQRVKESTYDSLKRKGGASIKNSTISSGGASYEALKSKVVTDRVKQQGSQTANVVFDQFGKTSTGLTGVPVIANARQLLSQTLATTMEHAAKLPKELALRGHLLQMCGDRLARVLDEGDIEELERSVNCGQIEELVAQAEAELTLVKRVLDDKPWETQGFVEPTSIPIGIIHHENLEGDGEDENPDYHATVSALMEDDAKVTPFEEPVDHENKSDAYATLLYHVYEKPRTILGEKTADIEHLEASSDTAVQSYMSRKFGPEYKK